MCPLSADAAAKCRGPRSGGPGVARRASAGRQRAQGRPAVCLDGGEDAFQMVRRCYGLVGRAGSRSGLLCGGLPLFPGQASGGRRPGAGTRRDRPVRRLVGPGIRVAPTGVGGAGGEARDRAISRRATARGKHRTGFPDHLSRARGGLHSFAASLGRFDVAPDGAGADLAGPSDGAHRGTSGLWA